MRFENGGTVIMITFFWGVISCSLVGRHRF